MAYTKPSWMVYDTIAGCPDCGSVDAIENTDGYDECTTVEENADEVVLLFFQCGLDLDAAFAIPASPTATEIAALLDAGTMIAKKTTAFAKGASEVGENQVGYAPAKAINKTHVFTWQDPEKDIAGQKHRIQYNQINAWAKANRLNFGYVTQNNEFFLYIPADGKNVRFSLDDTQEVGENSIENLNFELRVKINDTDLNVPYRISGLYSAVKAKVNGVDIAA